MKSVMAETSEQDRPEQDRPEQDGPEPGLAELDMAAAESVLVPTERLAEAPGGSPADRGVSGALAAIEKALATGRDMAPEAELPTQIAPPDRESGPRPLSDHPEFPFPETDQPQSERASATAEGPSTESGLPAAPFSAASPSAPDERRTGLADAGEKSRGRKKRKPEPCGDEPEGGGSSGSDEKAHYYGHRRRLRERFLQGGPDALPDYELLELMLFQALPRGDVKPLAKQLLGRFGSFAGVVTASAHELSTVSGVGEAVIAALKVAQAAAVRMAREEFSERPVIGAWDQLLEYCRIAMAHEKVEQFRLLFLDKHNRLIADEVQQVGTVDHTPVYPREVLKRALELGACAIIMVHNHPTGNPEPSKADISMTLQVEKGAKALEIALHDHLIIAKGGHRSLRSMGYLT